MFVTEITQSIRDDVLCVFHRQNDKNCQVVVPDFVSSNLSERWSKNRGCNANASSVNSGSS